MGGRSVALDGTKMRAVASPKNIAGAERLARDIAHTEKEIVYYLDRLDIIDETVAQGFEDQPLHREGFKTGPHRPLVTCVRPRRRRGYRLRAGGRQELLTTRSGSIVTVSGGGRSPADSISVISRATAFSLIGCDG